MSGGSALVGVLAALIIWASASPAEAQRVVSLDDETLVVTDFYAESSSHVTLTSLAFASRPVTGPSWVARRSAVLSLGRSRRN